MTDTATLPDRLGPIPTTIPPRAYLLSRLARAGLLVVALGTAPTTASGADIKLLRGHSYPVCVAVLAALQRMPPSTDLNAWPERLPPIHGVTRPGWAPLDPAQHLDMVRAFIIKKQHQESFDRRSDEAIWAEIGPEIEQDVRSGKMQIEEAVVPRVKLGVPSQTLEQRPWTTDIHFLRIGSVAPTIGTLGAPDRSEPGRTHTSWAYMVASFSLFPGVHDDLIQVGRYGLDLLLVGGQPWFIILPGSLGIPYTNDLENGGPDADHRIYVDEDCTISFPFKIP